MEGDLTFSHQGDYLFVVVNCEWIISNAKRVIDQTRLEAEKYGVNRILFDLRRWSTPVSEMVRYSSGEYLAEKLGPPFKVAAFANPEHINKLGENVAVNRFASYAIFSQQSDALTWLLN